MPAPGQFGGARRGLALTIITDRGFLRRIHARISRKRGRHVPRTDRGAIMNPDAWNPISPLIDFFIAHLGKRRSV